MISLEQFEDIISFIKEQSENQVRLNKVFTETFEDSVFYPYLKYEAKMIELLENIMNDRDNDICYFIYETHFGRDADKYFITLEDGTEIHFYTTEDLYNYLMEENQNES